MERERVNILIVDDRPSNLVALESCLYGEDYNVVTATSGSQGLLKLQELKDFALILTDIMMPGMDGFEFIERVKATKELENIPVIFVTAMSSEFADVLRGYEVGGVDYIPKPFAAEVVRAKVKVFAELHRQKELVRQQALRIIEINHQQEEAKLEQIKREAQVERLQALKDIAERHLAGQKHHQGEDLPNYRDE